MFKGFANIANIGSIIKQAHEMGGRLKAVNDELKTKRAVGSAGGGMVEVEVTGLGEVVAVRIDPGLAARDDREMLEDLLVAAFNSAHQKSKELHAEAIKSITGGMEIPGLNAEMTGLEQGPEE